MNSKDIRINSRPAAAGRARGRLVLAAHARARRPAPTTRSETWMEAIEAAPAPPTRAQRRLASVLCGLRPVGPVLPRQRPPQRPCAPAAAVGGGGGGTVGLAGSCYGELEALRREHGQAGSSELHVTHLDDVVYPTTHRVQQFCAAAVGMSALLAADILEQRGGAAQRVEVDARRAAAQTWAPNYVRSSEPFESYMSPGLREARANPALRAPKVHFPSLLTGSDGGRVNLMLASRRNVLRAAELLGVDAVELGAMESPTQANEAVQAAVDATGWTGEELEHELQECGGTVGLFRTAVGKRC
eukprot:COSAG06_NODE_1457_length_9417_cov_58.780425_7_plen_301_part_00